MKNSGYILFFYYQRSPFVIKDIDILRQEYNVVEFCLAFSGKSGLIWKVLSQLWFILRYIRKSKVLVCFFSGYHSFLPALLSKIFCKKCLVIAGGTDCVSFPAINYGNFRKQPSAFFTRLSYVLATCIAPVHERLISFDYKYDEKMKGPQGIQHHCKGLKTRIVPLHNGYDTDFWYPSGAEKEFTFVTVAYNVGNKVINELKGIDLILEAATALPEHQFLIIGKTCDNFPSEVPGNVTFTPPLKQDAIRSYFQKSAFYLQLSLSEGFPNSLSEAMLCGCIPVGSDVGGIPDIIGDTGFILNFRQSSLLNELLKKALTADQKTLSLNARQRISDNFPVKRRSRELLELIHEFSVK